MTEPDVDARLRGYADRWRGAQTQPPTVGELTVPSSSSARSRSSLVLAVAASVVTVAVIAGGAILIGRHGNATPVAHPALSVVPWNPTGVMPVQTTVPFPARVGASAGTKQCTASDFTLASTHTEPDLDSSGWLNTSYVLRSTAAQICSVSAYGINAALVDSAGQSLPNDAPQPAGPVM
ncbi:MAG: hypothetical protein ABI232_06235, partial [Jatrophihabitantaceae bacterium]